MALHKHRLTSIFLLSSSVLALGAFTACGDDDVIDVGDEDDAGAGGRGDAGPGSGGKGGNAGSSSTGGKGGTGGDVDGGAGTDGGPIEGGAPDGDAGTMAMLRVVHAAPGATSVDVYISGETTPVVEELGYGEATEYLELAAGDYTFDVRAAGDAATATPLYTTDEMTVEADGRYTAVAAGNIESTDSDDEFRVIAFAEDFGDDEDDMARVRIVHAGFDAPTVGVDLNNDDASEPEVAAIERFAATDEEGVEVPADTSLQVGIVADDQTVTAFTTPELDEGDDLFVIATGELSRVPREDGSFSLLVVMPDSSTAWIQQNPIVYALHASPDAGAVDVFIGDSELIDSATFGDLVRLQVIPDVPFTIDFFAGEAGESERPADDPVVSLETSAFEAGNQYLIAAGGELGEDTFELIEATEAFDLEESMAQIRAVHASGDAPSTNLGTVTTTGTLDSPPLFADLSYLETSDGEGLAIEAGDYTMGISPANDTDTSAEFDTSFAEGDRAFVVIGGDFTGGTNPLQLLIVDTTASPWVVTAVDAN